MTTAAPPASTPSEDSGHLVLTGDLDAARVDGLRARLSDEVRPGRRLVVDLSGVQELSTGALGVLIGAHRRLQASGGALVLASPSSSVARVLRVSGLHRVLLVA